ncbi:MAG TPA: tetratricopeptide repeat protein [Bryobacteraceae bacterium]
MTLTAGEAEIEKRFEAARQQEIVRGDLRGAELEYNSLLASPSTARSVAAKALYQLGRCFEKSGRRAEARQAYSRLVKDYSDQPATPAARARLNAWDDALAGPVNLAFKEGTPGKVPPGWFVSALPKDADRWAEWRQDGCRTRQGCAIVLVPENAPIHFSELMQNFSAAPFRGKTVRMRAWLRLEDLDSADPTGSGQIWLRVDRAKEQGFDRKQPVTQAQWRPIEIRTQVDDDATFIEFGIMSFGTARVWVDDVSFEVVPRQ